MFENYQFITLLATFIAGFLGLSSHFSKKIGRLDEKLTKKIEEIEKRLTAKIDNLN